MENNNQFSRQTTTEQKTQKPFAEVIESNLSVFIAQCWEWDDFPDFGSLVKVENNKQVVLGCIIQIQTGSSDPSRQPFPYKKTEAELKAEQPQIFEFLKTTFDVQILGYAEKITNKKFKIHYSTPPTPCKIHSFVQKCSLEQCQKFFQNPDFLHLLFAFQKNIPNINELILSILSNLSKQNRLDRQSLDRFCQVFLLLIGNDYQRLRILLRRIENLV
jgi:hypothetical protein